MNALTGFFSSFVVQLLGGALLLLGVLAAVFRLDARLGLAFAAFAALALGLLLRLRRVAVPHWQADRQRSADFYGYVGELLSATEELRSSGAEGYALRRHVAHLRDWLPVRRRAGLWGQAVFIAAIVLFAVDDALAYAIGGSLYLRHAISLGAVYMLVAYAAMLANPIETIRTQLQDLQRADAAIARLTALLGTPSALVDGVEPLPPGLHAVEFRGVTVAYPAPGTPPRPPALREFSFQLAAGRTLGVLGHTGSGKSAIARLLFRQYDPQRGEVRLGGLVVRRASLAGLRRRAGLVTQDVQVFEATLRDNLTFFDPAVPDQRLLALLGTLGLRPWLDHQPQGLDTVIAAGSLSAGEAQLLALARVFLKDPGLVILDEASSRLDPATEALLERAVATLLAGRSAIIIARRLATLERADGLLILEGGRVVERGARAALAADPASTFVRLRRTGRPEVPA